MAVFVLREREEEKKLLDRVRPTDDNSFSSWLHAALTNQEMQTKLRFARTVRSTRKSTEKEWDAACSYWGAKKEERHQQKPAELL